jgi:hypothetical protein
MSLDRRHNPVVVVVLSGILLVTVKIFTRSHLYTAMPKTQLVANDNHRELQARTR